VFYTQHKPMERGGYIYIVSNYERTTLYIGVTANLSERIFDHESGKGSEFTTKYKCKYLIYFEGFQNIEEAIAREKVLKKWNREWKLNLIRKSNPEFKSLNEQVYQDRL